MMYISRDRGDILDPIILEIDPIVIGWGDTQFSDKNATCNDAKIFDDFEQFSNLNFKLFKLNYFSIKSTKDKMNFKSEVLVKRLIPLQYILNINKYKNMI